MTSNIVADSTGIVAEQTLYTVAQLCAAEPALTPGGVRHLIFNAKTNGLAAAGAIVRMGRKVMIHRPRLNAWLESGASAAPRLPARRARRTGTV